MARISRALHLINCDFCCFASPSSPTELSTFGNLKQSRAPRWTISARQPDAVVARVAASQSYKLQADSKEGKMDDNTMDDNTLYDIVREKGILRGPKRREAVRVNTLTAFRGVSSKWCYWFRCTSAKKVPRKIVARILSEESVRPLLSPSRGIPPSSRVTR